MTEALQEDTSSNHARDQLGGAVEINASRAADPGELAALKDEAAYRTFLEALD